jgi:deoxyribodipyrimidine photolyase
MNLVWFRNDLRLTDNPALQAAASLSAYLTTGWMHNRLRRMVLYATGYRSWLALRDGSARPRRFVRACAGSGL